MRQDQRDMSGLRDHRMAAVRVALARFARVDVNVGDDGALRTLYRMPQRAVVPAIEAYDAGIQAVRIEVIIEHKVGDS